MAKMCSVAGGWMRMVWFDMDDLKLLKASGGFAKNKKRKLYQIRVISFIMI